MASANFDQLHVDLSRRLDDGVASASTAGNVFSVAQRSLFLNEAVKRLMFKYKAKVEREGELSSAWDFFRSLITSEGQATTSNSIALSSYTGGVFKILKATNSTVVVKPVPLDMIEDIALSIIPWFDSSTTNQYYHIQAGNLTTVGAGATDTITLRYIKDWADMTPAYASDIPIPSKYFHQILDIAYRVAMEEVASAESVQVAALKEQIVDKEIA